MTSLMMLQSYLLQQAELGLPDFFFAGEQETAGGLAGAPPNISEVTPYHISVANSEEMRETTVFSLEEKREALTRIYKEVNNCTACPLSRTRKKTVFGAGNPDAPLLVIGEAPGADEDRRGLPFVGAAGQLLTKMLSAIGRDRARDVFITNILKCRPPMNRNPETGEILRCVNYLRRQIQIIRPRVILLLGRIAAQNLLETTKGIGRLRTERHAVDGVPAFVTYHPASMLRNPSYKRPAWEDLQRVDAFLAQGTEVI